MYFTMFLLSFWNHGSLISDKNSHSCCWYILTIDFWDRQPIATTQRTQNTLTEGRQNNVSSVFVKFRNNNKNNASTVAKTCFFCCIFKTRAQQQGMMQVDDTCACILFYFFNIFMQYSRYFSHNLTCLKIDIAESNTSLTYITSHYVGAFYHLLSFCPSVFLSISSVLPLLRWHLERLWTSFLSPSLFSLVSTV